jgi:hypothetical protein
MKAIDFTHPGGFPLTQDQLDYLQQAYTECINAIAAMGAGTAPILISGMSVSSAGLGSTSISPGWFFYNGEMIQFLGGVYAALTLGDVPLVSITPSAGSLTYNDGSTYGAILNKTATISVGPPVTSATQFPFSSLQPFQLMFGQRGREQSWSSLTVSTAAADGGVTGTVYYKKDLMANTLQIRGFLTANNAQNFPASPSAIYSLMGTLPAGYIPSNIAYFTSLFYISSLIEDDLGISWIKQVNCAVNTGGQLLINWIRPDISITSYGLEFNTLLPLD